MQDSAQTDAHTVENPPAFPVPDTHHDGLSLRDYFAAAALSRLACEGDTQTLETITQYAYIYADLMLKARVS